MISQSILSQAIQRLRPNAEFSITNGVIKWDKVDGNPPTQAEIDAEIAYLESPESEVEKWRSSFSVDLYKLKIALELRGDLDTIETIISGQPKRVQLAWENTPRVRRDSPTVASLATAMSYTPETLDQIFKEAEQVQL